VAALIDKILKFKNIKKEILAKEGQRDVSYLVEDSYYDIRTLY
jgi:hypothetical protein